MIMNTMSCMHSCTCTVDAAYEGTKKRSFLPMAIMLGINLLLLLGFVVLYPQLGKREREDRKTEDNRHELEQ